MMYSTCRVNDVYGLGQCAYIYDCRMGHVVEKLQAGTDAVVDVAYNPLVR